jgi:hypothetical protein
MKEAVAAVAARPVAARLAAVATHGPARPVAAKSSNPNTMRTWFKYGLGFLLLCLVIAFFSRERFESSTPPERPVKLETPFSHVLYTSD